MTSLIFGHRALDRMLAAGADPRENPKLERRARKLASRRFRAGLAAGLRNVIDAAEEPPRGLSAAVPLAREETLRERELLLGLAAELVTYDDLNPRGIARIEWLLTDGGSPLYRGSHEGDLHDALIHARAALHLD